MGADRSIWEKSPKRMIELKATQREIEKQREDVEDSMPLLKCQQRVIDYAASMGASVDIAHLLDCGGYWIDARVGYEWNASCCACICISATNGSEWWWAQAGEEAIREMRQGMTLCDEDSIKRIEHLYERAWRAPAGSPATIMPETKPVLRFGTPKKGGQ